MIAVTHFSDPGCPWAYSASPALAVLRWRYRDQLRLAAVIIGLTEKADQYVQRGYTPASRRAATCASAARGMPFATRAARARHRRPASPAARSSRRGCSAPEREFAVFRALQFGWFTTPLVFDERDALRRGARRRRGLDAAAIVAALDDPEVEAAYQADRAEARTAEGKPTHAQGKAAQSDGPVRYTAPSLIFASGGRLPGGRRLPARRGL